MFLGLKVLNILKKFEFRDRIELTNEVEKLSQ